jgi:hypothetical protein
MKYNRLGSSDLNVSEICLGTMTWGEQNSEKEAHEQLHYAVSRGINFIDAAEMYPVPPKAETQGRTESYLGTWLRKQQRDKVIVATKITAPGRGFNWVRGGPEAVDRKSIQEALNGSLSACRPTMWTCTRSTGRTAICRCLATFFTTRRGTPDCTYRRSARGHRRVHQGRQDPVPRIVQRVTLGRTGVHPSRAAEGAADGGLDPERLQSAQPYL